MAPIFLQDLCIVNVDEEPKQPILLGNFQNDSEHQLLILDGNFKV